MVEMSKHSNGTWQAETSLIHEDFNDGAKFIMVFGPEGPGYGRVANAYAEIGDDSIVTLQANARLIAAAPELLEACEELLEELEAHWGASSPAYVMGEAAIAKAKGQ